MDWITKARMEQAELQRLFQQAAAALIAPKKCVVRFQEAAKPGVSGMVSRDEQGVYVIDISPNNPLEWQYGILLHEVGHILDDTHTIRPSSYHRKPPNTDRDPAPPAEAAVRPRLESTADRIAKRLESYAECHAYDHLKFGEPVLFAKLRALMDYQAHK
jgi:hypothetical protein